MRGDLMFVKAPFNKRFHSKMSTFCKVLWQKEGEVMYEVIGDVSISSADLGMSTRRFIEFFKKITVEGGRKVRKGNLLFIKPKREKLLYIRLSDEEFQLLSEYANEQNICVSAVIRKIVDSAIRGTRMNAI